MDVAYDAADRLMSIGDDFSTYAYTYDLLRRVTEVDNSGTPNQPNVVLASPYDANGNRTSLSATVNGTADFVNAYSYDNLSRMTRIEQTDGQKVTIVGTSGSSLRRGITLGRNEELAPPVRGRDAETDIINYARDNGIQLITIGTSRNACYSCLGRMLGGGIYPASPNPNDARAPR